MQFAYPIVLLLLVVPAGLLVWQFRRRGGEVRLPFDHGETADRPWLTWTMRIVCALPCVLLITAIILLARPQRTLVGETVREVRNIHLVLDVSGSMNIKYGRDTRFAAATEALKQFVHHRKGDAFALSAFGADVVNWLPLTKDLSGFDLAGAFLHPNRWPPTQTGMTNIGKALVGVQKQLDKIPGDRTIVLLTDGNGDDLGAQRSAEIGRQMAAKKIAFFGVFIGGRDPTPDLQRLADAAGGKLFAPNNPQALTDAFRRIDAMQTVRQTPITRTAVDATGPFLWTAIITLGLTLLAGFGLRYTPW